MSLAEYVNEGGHLVMIGDFAAENEALAKRQSGTSEWAQLMTGASGMTVQSGRGKVIRCVRSEAALAALGSGASVLACPNEDLAPHVKVNAFRSLDGAPGRIVVHVVNYNVPLGVNAPGPTPVDGIELDVPLPEETRRASAEVYAPGEAEAASLPVRIRNGRARICVPQLQVYRVIEIQLQ